MHLGHKPRVKMGDGANVGLANACSHGVEGFKETLGGGDAQLGDIVAECPFVSFNF